MNARQKLVLKAVFIVLAGTAICGGAVAKAPPPSRLPAPASFLLATEAAFDAAAKSPVLLDLRLHRGRLTLGFRNGGHLLAATGTYEWDVDQPTLETGEKIAFRSGRADIESPSVWQSLDSSLPRYDLLLGSPHLDHELQFTGDSGRAELNLAGIRLSGCDLVQNSGRLQARFGDNATACRFFTATLNAGTLDLSALGGLGAGTYGFAVHSGVAVVEFGHLKSGVSPAIDLVVDSGTVNLELPPGSGFQVELAVKSGLVYVVGQRYAPGRHSFALGPPGAMGRLRIEVNSGIVRIR